MLFRNNHSISLMNARTGVNLHIRLHTLVCCQRQAPLDDRLVLTASPPISKMARRQFSLSQVEHRIISFRNTSQYASGSPSACGLASVNAVRTILTGFKPGNSTNHALEKEETAIAIMAICQYWHSEEHLEVHDILGLPLFQCQLETVEVEENQSIPNNFRKLARSLTRGGPCAAVITRTPEIVSIMNIPAKDERGGSLLVIFDSHPRPEHPHGAAFLLFTSPEDAGAYLSHLFRMDSSIMLEDNWQTQMLSRYNAHIIRARRFTKEDNLKAVYDANTKLLKTSVEMKQAIARESEMQSEVFELRQKLEAQREARKQAFSAETAADERLKELRKDLQSAQNFAKSLSNMNNLHTDPWSSHSAPVDDFEPSGYNRHPTHPPSNPQSKGKASTAPGFKPNIATRRDSVPSTSVLQVNQLSSNAKLHHPSPSNRQPSHLFNEDEAKEYERIRLANIAAKSAERKQKLLAEKEQAQRREQEEAERNDFEMARRLQMEDERLQKQQSALLHTVDRGFECPICIEHWSVGMISQNDACGHAVCRNCMIGNVKVELEQMRWPVICPVCRANPTETGEPGVISRELVELAGADGDILSEWSRVELASVSVAVECPLCHNVSHVDREDYDTTLFLWCPLKTCPGYWCKTCSQPAERGKRHTCDGQAEFDRWKDVNKDKVRECPGCKQPIERTEGCRHMTCITPGCNTHFCDRCGGLIIKSQVQKEIKAAMAKHYTGCVLFDIPDER